jgi:hypothetical protein
VTVPGLRTHEAFLRILSEDGSLNDDRFVPRNFRLDEIMSDRRAAAYARDVLPAADFFDWQGKHAQFCEDHLVCTAGTDGPPDALDPTDPAICPATFAGNAVASRFGTTDLKLSLVRIVGLYRVAEALGVDEASIKLGLEDPVLRDGIIERWVAKLHVEPVFATFWQDVKDLVPKSGTPPPEWADDLRDRLGLSFLDPDAYGPIRIMVLRYRVADVPVAGNVLARPLTVPTELDGLFFPAFCPAPDGTGIGRIVDLGRTLTTPWPELLHPTCHWRGEHVAQLGVVSRSVPSVAVARGRHLKLLQKIMRQANYGIATDADLL